MEPRSPSKFKGSMAGFIYNQGALNIGLTLLFIVLLLSIGAYVVLRSGKTRFVRKESYYTVVVDCGSTGTRISVFEWMIMGELSDQNLPVLIHSYPDNSSNIFSRKNRCQYHCMQTEPGLDKFVGNSSGVRLLIEPLLRWTEQWVPPDRHRETPIFVLATAGLRRLPMDDAIWVLENVQEVIKEHKFMYRKSWFRVLSGEEEAYYGWVALNYKMGTFNKSTKLPTLGLLDIGGSSFQFVAEVDDSREDELFLSSKIRSLEHRVLAYSWPAFGLNDAFDRTIVMLSHSQALRESGMGTFEVSHPCMGSNFVQNYSCRGCFGLSNTDSDSFSSQVSGNALNSIFLVGQPNWEQCKLLARAAAVNPSSLDWSLLEDSSKCHLASINGSTMLNLTTITNHVARFHALSGFFAVYSKLNLSSRTNLTKIWEKGMQLCFRSWANLSSNQNYAPDYCFRVPYLVSLIEDALCLSDKEITFGPGDISWTLGAAIVEGDFLWLGTSRYQIDFLIHKNSDVISSSIFLFIFLIGMLFLVYRCQIKLPMSGKRIAGVGASLPSYICTKRNPN